MPQKNYYNILGVERGTSKDNIKKAYHKLARKYHPDNKQTGDESRFKEVSEAYHTLSDDKKRAEYDAYGNVFSGAAGESRGFSGFSSPFGGGGEGFQDFDIGDIFGEFFGGARAKTRRGRDISVDIEVSFAEAIFGTTRSFLLAKTTTCSECKGSGAEPETKMKTCSICNGKGRMHETRSSLLGTFTTVEECAACGGIGSVPEKKCRACHGIGVTKKQEEITIIIPAGIEDGGVIRLTGAGEAVPRGTSGDVYARVRVLPHPMFKRDGSNLVMRLGIKLTDALLGAEYTIETLEGTKIKVKVPAGISFGEILRVKGKGIPLDSTYGSSTGRGRRGNLLIKLDIRLPNKLSREAKTLAEKLRGEGI